ncbi:MAG: hypothetical protein ABGX16_03315 [Pirellulales bacterium]
MSLDARLAELRKKHGRPPNIIHIMWDDTAFGDVGIPAIQQVRGLRTPNLNDMAKQSARRTLNALLQYSHEQGLASESLRSKNYFTPRHST